MGARDVHVMCMWEIKNNLVFPSCVFVCGPVSHDKIMSLCNCSPQQRHTHCLIITTLIRWVFYHVRQLRLARGGQGGLGRSASELADFHEGLSLTLVPPPLPQHLGGDGVVIALNRNIHRCLAILRETAEYDRGTAKIIVGECPTITKLHIQHWFWCCKPNMTFDLSEWVIKWARPLPPPPLLHTWFGMSLLAL